ncbi:MAG: hypothetical protein K6T85_09895, partial [Gorillibacterium sp.]|nr:hypothetical protein [Gorillibacterium sp.]
MDRITREPSKEEQLRLYKAADNFKKTKPWEWLSDRDIVGVQNPENGEIGYCCTMGAGGEAFGMNLYPGTEGWNSYRRLRDEDIASMDLLAVQKCLSVNFEDRKDLNKADLDEIKELGLKYRGANQWPVFRFYEPGYVAWFLNADQVRFLTTALEQVARISLELLNQHHDLEPRAGNQLLTLVRSDEGQGGWMNTWRAPESWVSAGSGTRYRNELELKRAADPSFRIAGTW